MKISVVICAKNEEHYLPKCIAALRKQLLRPEIVVVYNKSRDKTAQIAKKLADVAVQDNGKGLSPARNLGIKTASGNIIAYCDADATPKKDWTVRIVHAFEDNPDLLALSGPLILINNYNLKLRIAFRLWAELFPDFFAAIGHHNIWGPNMAFRREVLQKFKFNSPILEDYEIGKKLRKSRLGELRFDCRLKMPVSSRRFDRSFHRTAIKYYALNWLRLVFGKPIKYNYL